MANTGSFVKGQKRPNQGKRGPNKASLALKEMILLALDEAGGIEYLRERAQDNPNAFLALIGRVLPLQVSGDGGGPLKFELAAPWLKQAIQQRNSTG